MGLGPFIIRDFIVLICVGVFTLCCQLDWFVGDNLHNRGFFRGDRSIGLPIVHDEIMPAGYAAIFAFGMPVVCLIITWFAVDRIWTADLTNSTVEAANRVEYLSGVPLLHQTAPRDVPQDSALAAEEGAGQSSSRIGISAMDIEDGKTPTSTTSNNGPTTPGTVPENGNAGVLNWGLQFDPATQSEKSMSRKLRFALYQFFILCLCMCFCIIVTVAIKLMVGRLRPDFLARCMPDYSLLGPGDVDAETGWISAENVIKICKGLSDEIIEGRKSFPSQHASTAWMGATFTALVLYKRCWNRGARVMGFVVVPFIIMCVLGGAAAIATSRHIDNRHHPLDIIIGSLIGIACAFASLPFNMYTPSWEMAMMRAKGVKVEDTF